MFSFVIRTKNGLRLWMLIAWIHQDSGEKCTLLHDCLRCFSQFKSKHKGVYRGDLIKRLFAGQRTWKDTSPKKTHKWPSRWMKRCSPSPAVREMQIRTAVRYHLTAVRMAGINKTSDNKRWRGWRGKGTSSTTGGNVERCSHSGKQCGGSSKN